MYKHTHASYLCVESRPPIGPTDQTRHAHIVTMLIFTSEIRTTPPPLPSNSKSCNPDPVELELWRKNEETFLQN